MFNGHFQRLFLVAILVGICKAGCANGPIQAVGSIPCPIITPNFGTYGLGGSGGNFPGVNANNVPSM